MRLITSNVYIDVKDITKYISKYKLTKDQIETLNKRIIR